MKNQKNTTKTYPIHVGAIINRPFFEKITKNNNPNSNGITLIVLVITIIILLILAGVVLNLTLGEHGILKKAEQSAEQYKISEILEKLELEKVDLVARKNGEIPSLQEYIDHLINKGTITLADVTDIDANNKTIVVEGYVFLVEKETNGNIKITYQGKDTKEPKIANLQVTGTTIDSISVKVIASNANGASYKYSIKNVTAGETTFTEVTTLTTNEYTFTGLTINNEYIIQVELVTVDATDTKETDTIKTEPPKVTSITLDKTNIELVKGGTDVITATVLPENAIDKTITWTSSNTDVVTVDNSGNVTAVGEGVAIITATSNEVSTVTASCNITVTLPPPPTVGVGGETHTAKQIPYTWEELNSIAKVISDNYGTEAGKVNNNTAEVNVSINGKSGTLGIGDWTTVNGKQVRILGFNHDPLTNTNAYGEGEANTYAGISFEYTEVLMQAKIDDGGAYANRTKKGWETCTLRSTLNNTTITTLENKEYIKEVNKIYIPIHNVASTGTVNDKLWLLSCSEIWNNGASGRPSGLAMAKEGERYKYYNVNLGDTKYTLGSRVTSKSSMMWSLRSPAQSNDSSNMINAVDSSGACGKYNIGLYGVAPGFAI